MSMEHATHLLTEGADADPYREGQLTARALEVGAVMRRPFRNLLRDVELNGGEVTIRNEYRGWFSTTYTGIKIVGPAWLLAQVAATLRSLMDGDDD